MPKRTPLYHEHVKAHAKMVDFAGWEMPVQYTGVIDEHKTVREHAGLFDVSHMGQVLITGPKAQECIQNISVNDVSKLKDGKAQYSIMCHEHGGCVDDIIIYRQTADRFLIVVNASNRDKDVAWMKNHRQDGVTIEDVSDHWALIALQGPTSANILSRVSSCDLLGIPSFEFREATIAGKEKCIVARTGYTGEIGCEIFCAPSHAADIWSAILGQGKISGLKPAGLGARDTLRLEMCYSLYGHEISDEITPLEAGLDWVVKLNGLFDFIGKKALLQQKAEGLKRKLTGFRMIDPGIPRQGYAISVEGKSQGIVTSGTMSPSLGVAIGLGLVPTSFATPGAKFSIDIRGSLREAEAVSIPFYRKQ